MKMGCNQLSRGVGFEKEEMLLVDFNCQPPLTLVLEDEEDYLHQLVAAQRKNNYCVFVDYDSLCFSKENSLI